MAWKEFRRGKRSRRDIQEFELNLEDNIFNLYKELKDRNYQHSNYTQFYINDPKLRRISKACVRDRLLHQAIFRILYPVFDNGFIFDSYSCRLEKGTHKAVKRLEKFCLKLSRNNNKNVFALKCDIKKFFDSVDHKILVGLIEKRIQNKNALWLIKTIIKSFEKESGKGLPLGNVTSQLFANIYLNELDQFIKRKLKLKFYIRYCDDFVILRQNKESLLKIITLLESFIKEELKLSLHSDKIIIRKYHQGIDFLGYVVLPCHKVLRTKTKKRIIRKIKINQYNLELGVASKEYFNQSIQSYLGVLSHCNGYKIEKEIIKFLYHS